MELSLSNEEIRILGCLIEKEMATPEYYPLSMNALVNACNQKSNREPVVAWNEEVVSSAIEELKDKDFAFQSNLSRVPKFEEHFVRINNLNPPEAAVLCVLMLRGPQTAGEIRGRTERLFAFENLEAVNNTLENLISQKNVTRLPRQPGRKEVRYYHTLHNTSDESGDSAMDGPKHPATKPTADSDRIAALEEKVASLSQELNAIKEMFTEFKRQFE